MMPVPGVDVSLVRQWFAQNSNEALNLFSSFTGGSLDQFSFFALGVTPLITAQIIVQLLASFIPALARYQKRGEHGQKALKFITNIAAIVLAAIWSCGMAIGFNNKGLIHGNGVVLLVTACMTAGTGVMMCFAELLTKKAFGNGVSILLMVNIASRLPGNLISLFSELTKGKPQVAAILSVAAAILVLFAMVFTIIYMTEGYHPLRVQFSQKMSPSGRKADTGMIPVKVCISSTMPVIFASSIMAIPQMVATLTGKGYGSGFSKTFLNMMSQQNWFNGENEIYSIGLLIYLFLIIFFSFFYLPIAFNGAEVADGIRKFGGFVPNVRAGEDTEWYVTTIARNLTAKGTVMLILVTVVPIAICGTFGIQTQINGTSLIIMIGVMTDTIQQIHLETVSRNSSLLVE